MTSLAKPIQLSGKTETKENKNDVKKEVLAQAEQMDLVTTQAADAVPKTDDIQDKPQDEKVKEAKQAAKQTLSDKRSASLAKARAAKAEKAKRMKAEGLNAAQGTPSPDVLETLQSSIAAQFKQFNDSLQDLKKQIGQTVPQIESQQVESVRLEPHESVATNNDILRHQVVTQVGVPTATAPKRHHSEMQQEQTQIANKFQKIFDTYQFVNPSMQQRMNSDQTTGSRNSQSSSDFVYLF